jgi:hypothetical protein
MNKIAGLLVHENNKSTVDKEIYQAEYKHEQNGCLVPESYTKIHGMK